MGLAVGLIAGAFDTAYFIYGKRREKISFIVAGISLCIDPYLFDNLLAQTGVGALLLALPFWITYCTDWDL